MEEIEEERTWVSGQLTICEDIDETITIDPPCLRSVQRLQRTVSSVSHPLLASRNARSSRDGGVEDCEAPKSTSGLPDLQIFGQTHLLGR